MMIQNKSEPTNNYDELISKFSRNSINQSLALNFMLGVFKTQMNRGQEISPERLAEILESSLRFAKLR